jgi:hypothetical protein
VNRAYIDDMAAALRNAEKFTPALQARLAGKPAAMSAASSAAKAPQSPPDRSDDGNGGGAVVRLDRFRKK